MGFLLGAFLGTISFELFYQVYPIVLVLMVIDSNFVVDAVYNLVEAERIDVFNIRKQYQTYANVSEGIIKGRRYIFFLRHGIVITKILY